MREYGQLRTCDICGRKVFCKELSADGAGYNFEEPDGWIYSIDAGDLCPECYGRYKKMIENLKRDRQDETSTADNPPGYNAIESATTY